MKKRELVLDPNRPGVVVVPLTLGRAAIIDSADARTVGEHNWHLVPDSGREYARAHLSKDGNSYRKVRLHRFLWGQWAMPETPHIDHVNGDGLDCRRINLRAATPQQNARNSKAHGGRSGHKGVSWHPQHRKWYARIGINGRLVSLGLFDDPEVAAAVYQDAARKHFGEFAHGDVR